MLTKFKDTKRKRSTYVGNMADLLCLIRDTKQELIAKHGVEEGTERFGKLKAKDVLDRYAVSSDEDVH